MMVRDLRDHRLVGTDVLQVFDIPRSGMALLYNRMIYH